MLQSITVKKSKLFNKFKSIQEAINQLADGGTIYVEAGVYEENIVVNNKDVSLIAQGHVILKMNNDYSVITVRGGKLTLKDLNLVQEGHSNVIILRQSAKVIVDNCHLTGETTMNAKELKFPVLYVDELCEAKVNQSKLTAHTGETVYIKGGFVSLEDTELFGSGIHAQENATLETRQLKINHPRSYGIWSEKSNLSITHLEMDGGGVVMISEASTGQVEHVVARSTYRDAFRLNNSDLIMKDIFVKNNGKIVLDNNKELYAAFEITNQSKVTLDQINIEDPAVEGIRIEASEVTANHLSITGGTLGVSCRKDASLSLSDLTISNTEYNAIVTKEVKKVKIKNAVFNDCVTATGKMNYPVMSMRKIETVDLNNIKIAKTKHDGILLEDITEAKLASIKIENVNLGLFIHNTIVSIMDLYFKDFLAQAIFARSATIQMENATIEHAFLNHDEKQGYSPHNNAAALMTFNSNIELRKVEIIDQSAAMFIGDHSGLQGENIIIGGQLFIQQSIAKITKFQIHESEKVALPIRLANYAQLELEFMNPDANILLNKEDSALFLSNLTEKPQMLVEVNFAEHKKTPKVTSLFKDQPKNTIASSSKVVPFHKEEVEPVLPLEEIEMWLKIVIIARTRIQQGLRVSQASGLILINETPLPIEKALNYIMDTLTENNWLTSTEIHMIQTENDLNIPIHEDVALVIIHNLIDLSLVDQFLTNAKLKEKQIPFILTGFAAEIEEMLVTTPLLNEKAIMQITLEHQDNLINITPIKEKLIKKQFIFNEDDIINVLKYHVVDEGPNWENQFIEAVIQAQASRLLAKPLDELRKADLETLTKTDFLQALQTLHPLN